MLHLTLRSLKRGTRAVNMKVARAAHHEHGSAVSALNLSDQILPTRSSEGDSVLSPGVHLAGHTSPGCEATYCAACTLRSNSFASRPMPLSCTSMILMRPSGLMTKVPR